MITIFQFIAFFGAVIGFAAGGVIGSKFYGTFGGFAGAIIGAYIGLITGRLPGFFGTRGLVRKIRCKKTEELRTILQGNQSHLFYFTIAELAVRGEEIQKERGCVSKLLISDNYAARVCGWRTLQHFFPEDAKQIAEYNPKDSIDVCRAKTRILTELP